MQLIFDDNTTTIGYKSDSVDRLLKRYISPANPPSIEEENQATSPEPLIVFASKSEDSEIALLVSETRVQSFIIIPVLYTLIAFKWFISTLVDARDVVDEIVFWPDLLLVVGGILFLLCLKRKDSTGFTVCWTLLVADILYSFLEFDTLFRSPIASAIEISIIFSVGFLVYLATIFSDAYSGHTLLVRRRSS